MLTALGAWLLYPRLGASASQVGPHGDYSHLLGMLNHLKAQIESSEATSGRVPAASLPALPAPGDAEASKECEGEEGCDEAEQGAEGEEGWDEAEHGEEGEEGWDETEQGDEGEEGWDEAEQDGGDEADEVAEDSEQEEQAESEQLAHNQDEARKVLKKAKHASDVKGKGVSSTRPVATPARSYDDIARKLQAVRQAEQATSPKPKPSQLTIAANPPSSATSAAPAGAAAPDLVNSTTHKREYMRLAPCLHSTPLNWLVWLVLLCKVECIADSSETTH